MSLRIDPALAVVIPVAEDLRPFAKMITNAAEPLYVSRSTMGLVAVVIKEMYRLHARLITIARMD
jgi:hypothetical protein